MWKAVGSVDNDGDKTGRSNRSRMDADVEPFHQSVRRRSNLSPEVERSFCQDYFDRHKNNTLNMTSFSNRSSKKYRGDSIEKDDMFTEIKNKNLKSQIGSKVESIKENPEKEGSRIQLMKKTRVRLNILKKDQKRLKKTLEKEFDSFKNYFYQMEERIHQIEFSGESEPIESGEKVD